MPASTPKLYRIRMKGGRLSRPLKLAEVLKLLKRGKISDSTLICREGSDRFVTMRDFIRQLKRRKQQRSWRTPSSRADLIRPEAQAAPVLESLYDLGIRAEAALRFLEGLPEREVVVQSPTSVTRKLLHEVRKQLKSIPGHQFVIDNASRTLLCELHKKGGWLKMVYLPIFLVAARHAVEYPSELPAGEIARGLYNISNSILSMNEVGMRQSDLRPQLARLIEISNEYRHFGAQSRWISVLLEDPILDLKRAVRIWDEDPGFIAIHFVVVGDTFRGLMTSVASSVALNYLAGLWNEAVRQHMADRVSEQLNRAGLKLALIRELCVQRLRHGDHPS